MDEEGGCIFEQVEVDLVQIRWEFTEVLWNIEEGIHRKIIDPESRIESLEGNFVKLREEKKHVRSEIHLADNLVAGLMDSHHC